MSRIKLDVEQMNVIASKYELQSENVETLIRDLDRMLLELQTYWEGASAQKFESNYLEIKPAIIRLKEVIFETSKVIKHTAASMYEIDKTIIG